MKTHFRSARGVCLGLAAAALLAPLAPPLRADDGAAQQAKVLHALFDRNWAWNARTFPEFATNRGDHRYGDRLSDASAEAITQRGRGAAARAPSMKKAACSALA